MADKLLGALSLCKKAGALAVGFDAVKDMLARRGVCLLLFASDTSPATRKRLVAAGGVSGSHDKQLQLRDLPYTQEELMGITHKPAGVLAVTNQDLAVLCLGAFANFPEVPDEEEIV